jgi:excisionase family DNA binding protein
MPSKATEPKFSIEQVAKILGGLHPTTVLRLLYKRKLGYYQFGNRKMVGQSHLDNYVSLAEREAKAKSIH